MVELQKQREYLKLLKKKSRLLANKQHFNIHTTSQQQKADDSGIISFYLKQAQIRTVNLSNFHFTFGKMKIYLEFTFFFKKIIHLFTCAYIVWVISPPCSLPLPPPFNGIIF
jgi:hypothetical protein